jgi:hypothetical protein
MDARYLEAIVNEDGQHVVLGRALHPFCFYDILILEVDDNPLWDGSRPARWGDLFTAVLACSSPPGAALSPAYGRGFWRVLRQRLWVLFARRKYKLQEQATAFQVYVKDYYTRPHVWSSAEGSAKAPWLLSIATYIEAHSNMTEHEIMSASAGKMMWKYGAIAEVLHGADLMSEAEHEACEAMGFKL